MGIFDKITEAAKEHKDKVMPAAEQCLDKVGDFIDEKTDHKYEGQVDQAQEFGKAKLEEMCGTDDQPAE